MRGFPQASRNYLVKEYQYEPSLVTRGSDRTSACLVGDMSRGPT